jgi:hypothetical protein
MAKRRLSRRRAWVARLVPSERAYDFARFQGCQRIRQMLKDHPVHGRGQTLQMYRDALFWIALGRRIRERSAAA